VSVNKEWAKMRKSDNYSYDKDIRGPGISAAIQHAKVWQVHDVKLLRHSIPPTSRR